MNNMQKSFKAKQKFRKGLCMATGTASIDEYGNDMTRTNQMREAASRMEAARLKGDAEFAARMAPPPVAAPEPVAAPTNGLLAQTTALAGLSNAERYRLGGSGTAAEASQLGQRSDILERLGGVSPPAMGQVSPKKPRIGLNFAQDFGGYADGTASIYPDGTASIYPQERVRQPEPEKLGFMGHLEKIGGLIKKAYGEATGQIPVAQPKDVQGPDVVGHIKQRAADNIAARDYADGTASIDRAEALMQRMQKEYGVASTPNAPEPATQPQQAAQPTPAPQGQAPATEPRRGLREAVDQRNEELRKVIKYKCGTARVGHAEGGIVRGKGGPTDDEVAMSIGGTEVNLSPREAVLPVKTVMALGGPAAVEDLIERTNGKPPVPSGLREGGRYAGGSVDKAEELMQRVSRKYGVEVPPAAPVVAPQVPEAEAPSPDVASGQRGLYKVIAGNVAKPFAHAIDAGLNLVADASGYDRPDKQAFVGPATALADEGLRQMAPGFTGLSGSSASIPDALGWKKRAEVAQVAPVQTGTQGATAPVQTGTQGAPEPAMAAAADIQVRSMAAEGLRSGAQRLMNLPPTQQQDVVNGGSLVQRGNVGLRSIATNPAVQDALNVANEQQGTGVTYSTVTGADGKPQVMISGGPATKAQYLDVNGKPTNDWRQTAQYAEAQAGQARNVQRLKEIEGENTRSDMASGLPFYQSRGLRATAAQLKADEIAQRGALTPAQAASLGLQRQALDATVANREEDNKRAATAAKQVESEAHRKATDDLVKNWATEDGKLNDQKYAFLQKYASQFERPAGMSSAEHLASLMDNFAIDTMGDEAGRHWLSQEGTWSGERTKWQKRAAKDSLRRGAPFQSIEYHDPLTGRTIYQSDVDKLSPKQRELFQSRVYK